MDKKTKGSIMQIVKIKTKLSEDNMFKIAKEREPEFKAIHGINTEILCKNERIWLLWRCIYLGFYGIIEKV